MVTEVHVEEATLDDDVVMVFRDFGRRVRMAFDPRRIAAQAALALLCLHIPRLTEAAQIIYR